MTGYGENGTGDANDVWRVEILGGKEGDRIQTVTTKIKLHHYFLKVHTVLSIDLRLYKAIKKY